MRKSDAARLRPVQHRGDHASRLADEGQISGWGSNVCKAGIQTEASHDHTDAVGSDDPQQVRLRRGEHLLLKLEPVLSQFGEPGRDNNGSLGARVPRAGQSGRAPDQGVSR